MVIAADRDVSKPIQLPAAEADGSDFTLPQVVPGKGDMLGWEVYDPQAWLSPENTRSVPPLGASPESAVVFFLSSLLQRNDDYKSALIENARPALREALLRGVRNKDTLGVKQWVIRARIDAKGADRVLPFQGKVSKVREMFGDFDRVIFVEDETSRHDTFFFLRNTPAGWRIVLAGGPFYRM